MQTRFVVAILLLTMAFGTTGQRSATAQIAEPVLWETIEDISRPLQRTAVHERIVRARPDVLRSFTVPGDRVRLPLSPATEVTAVLDEVSDDPFNGYVWAGHVAGEPYSMVNIVVEPDGIAGTVLYSGGTFEIRLVGDDIARVLENDPADPRLAVNDALSIPQEFKAGAALSLRPADRRAKSVWDVLFLYTAKAAADLGGKNAVKAAVKVAVANWNTALKNSKLKVKVRNVGTKKINYGPTGSDFNYGSQAIQHLQTVGDGQMDKAHTLRAKAGADFVHLVLQKNTSFCGLGYKPGNGAGMFASFSAWAFSVISSNCVSGGTGLTVAHEGGHNVGLNHDVDNARLPWQQRQVDGAWAFSFGYRIPGIARSVMAYSCTPDGLADCPRVAMFSWKKNKVGGKKLGTNKADNRKSIDRDRQIAGNWVACTKSC
jgi:hypothetical protein